MQRKNNKKTAPTKKKTNRNVHKGSISTKKVVFKKQVKKSSSKKAAAVKRSDIKSPRQLRAGSKHAVNTHNRHTDIKGKARSVPKGKPVVNAKAIANAKDKRMLQSQNRKERAVEKAKQKRELDEATYSENAIQYIHTLIEDTEIADYLNKNVSRHAGEVINLLSHPSTDEDIAAALDLKINAVRRILNIMQGYGITNYTVSKNNEGWLSFEWYINTNKVPQFFDYVKNTQQENSVLKDDCNDYFICDKCYDENRFIFTFDAAYEAKFKCNVCDKRLSRIDKDKVAELVAPEQKQKTEALQGS